MSKNCNGRASLSLSKTRAMPTLVSAEHATVPSSEPEGDTLGEGSVNPLCGLLKATVQGGAAGAPGPREGEAFTEERKTETEERPQCEGRYVSSACFGFGTGDR